MSNGTKLQKLKTKAKLSLNLEFGLNWKILLIVSFACLVIGTVTGFGIHQCPGVYVKDNTCCIDLNRNKLCDSLENNTRVVVQARGEGSVVIVSGLNVRETNNATSATPTSTTTTSTTTSTTVPQTTTTTTVDSNQSSTSTTTTTHDTSSNVDCDNVDITLIRVKYNDGEESSVEALMRNNGKFAINRFRVKVFDEENGLALQSRFYKQLNASMLDEFKFEFGSNDLVNSHNTVTKVEISPIIGDEVCDSYIATLDDIIIKK